MAMPKSGTRRITVDGRDFRYNVSCDQCWYVLMVETVPQAGSRVEIGFPEREGRETIVAVTPRDAARLIRAAIAAGWKPGAGEGIVGFKSEDEVLVSTTAYG